MIHIEVEMKFGIPLGGKEKYDIIMQRGKILGLNSYTKIVEVLINITNSNISWNSEIGEAKLNALELQKALEKNTLNLNFPELNTYLSRYRR